MDVKQAYKIWAHQYDTNDNKTRDLEAISLRSTLGSMQFDRCLEIGCGTGKNTEYLITKANTITAVDISEEMLAKAKAKINSNRVQFIQGDITSDWSFLNMQYDLVTFSLVLEHIENISEIFQKVSKATLSKGYIYVGELHPFKQYSGSKARFETDKGLQVVTCFNHNISDFTQSASTNGFEIVTINEYFDDGDKTTIPRILSLLFKKK
jgi:ubiquinone/menaquinone biosynthesis C-methylase UbiE